MSLATDTAARREWSAAVVALFGERDDNAAFCLVERAIDKELATTYQEELLWREESLMVDLVGEFVRAWSARPLLARVAPFIKECIKEAKKKDLSSLSEAPFVVSAAAKMLKAVLAGVEDSPRILKSTIKHIHARSSERFPGFQFRAVGALVGLRCYCPAIVSPDTYGLLRPGKEVQPAVRTVLVKVAKLLQYVFNETGLEQDSGLPEDYQNFIKVSIPQFHMTILSITEGMRLSDSDPISLPVTSPRQSEIRLANEESKSPRGKFIFKVKKRNKTSLTSSMHDGELAVTTSSDSLSPFVSPRLSPHSSLHSSLHLTHGQRLIQSGEEEEEEEDREPMISPRIAFVRSADDLLSAGLSPRMRDQSFSSDSTNSMGASSDEDGAENKAVPLRPSLSDSIFAPAEAGGIVSMSCSELLRLMKRYDFSKETRDAIKKANVKGETLVKMDAGALQALGVQKLGERKRLLRIVRESYGINGRTSTDRLIDIRQWSSDEVAKWVIANGFEEYQQLFLASGITGAQLAQMTEHQPLSELGISKWGHRQRMIRLIEEAQGVPSSSPRPKPRGGVAWTVEEVLNWLKAIDMEQYQEVFGTGHVTGVELVQLDDAQLIQLGVSSLGHRKRLLRNIALLSAQPVMSEQCITAQLSPRSHVATDNATCD